MSWPCHTEPLVTCLHCPCPLEAFAPHVTSRSLHKMLQSCFHNPRLAQSHAALQRESTQQAHSSPKLERTLQQQQQVQGTFPLLSQFHQQQMVRQEYQYHSLSDILKTDVLTRRRALERLDQDNYHSLHWPHIRFLKVLEESGVCGFLQNILLWITAAVPIVHYHKVLFFVSADGRGSTDVYVWSKVLFAKVQGSPQGRKDKM